MQSLPSNDNASNVIDFTWQRQQRRMREIAKMPLGAQLLAIERDSAAAALGAYRRALDAARRRDRAEAHEWAELAEQNAAAVLEVRALLARWQARNGG